MPSEYPKALERTVRLADGAEIRIRPIRPGDARIEQDFVRGLSPESRWFRFMDTLRELTPQMLRSLTEIDYDRHMALIALIGQPPDEVEIGVARYVAVGADGTSEFALVVADAWQRRGVGRALMAALIETAALRGVRVLFGDVMLANRAMLHLMGRLGFRVESSPDDPLLRRVVLDLTAPNASAAVSSGSSPRP